MRDCRARVAGTVGAVVAFVGLVQPGALRAAHAGAPPVFACQLLHDTGQTPFAVVAGDWNHDGRTDLAVSYAATGSVSVFRNEGHRVFQAQPEVKTGRVARGVGVADIDGDGDLDLAVTSATKHQTTLLINDGAGTFTVGRKLEGGHFPFTAAFSDLDRDGHQDLVVVNETNASDTHVRGTVAVFFDVGVEPPAAPLMLQAGEYPSDVQIADLDGQHGPDLAVTNWGSETVSIFLNNGDRTFSPAQDIRYGGQVPFSLYAADFNGDGKIDLAVTDLTGLLWILEGDGHGGFVTRRKLHVGEGTRSVTGGDINRDGYLDLFTADTKSGTVSVLLGKAGGEFADAIAIPVGRGPRMVIARDLDGDGRLDLAATLSGSDDVVVLFQTTGKPVPCVSAPTLEPDKQKGGK